MSEILATYKGYLIFRTKDGYEVKNEKVFEDDHRPVYDTVKDIIEAIDEDVFLTYISECS